MRVLDLFSGIGGFSLGLEHAGMRTVAFCEIDAFCRGVLAKHWPGTPIYDDVKTLTADTLGGLGADVVVGGFPCQDVSNAGKRAGITGERSGLYRELVRTIRLVRPRYAIVENVADLLSNGMGTVLWDLAESGFDIEWDCVPACAVGAPHERDRVWIVCHVADADQRIGPDGWSQRVRRWRKGTQEGNGPRPDADTASVGCGTRRERRPPDSFARIRDEARRNAADPYGARLAFGTGLGRNPREEQSSAQRATEQDERQSIWPDEPALLGVDDGICDRVDRAKALGNSLIPRIPEMIGRAIMACAV